jgi:hypothetical protein
LVGKGGRAEGECGIERVGGVKGERYRMRKGYIWGEEGL